MVVHLFLVNSLNEKTIQKKLIKFFFCQNHIFHVVRDIWGFPGGGGGNELSANAGDVRDVGSISGLGRSLGRGHSNSLQDSAWRIPWTEEPGGLQSMGSQRVGTTGWLSPQSHKGDWISRNCAGKDLFFTDDKSPEMRQPGPTRELSDAVRYVCFVQFSGQPYLACIL